MESLLNFKASLWANIWWWVHEGPHGIARNSWIAIDHISTISQLLFWEYPETGWWFGTWILFSIIYGMSSFPLTNSYFSRCLKPPTRFDVFFFKDISWYANKSNFAAAKWNWWASRAWTCQHGSSISPPLVGLFHFSPVKVHMEFSKVFKHLTSFNINHLTSFNINVGWYVHMLFLLVMNRFLVIGMIHHSARRRPRQKNYAKGSVGNVPERNSNPTPWVLNPNWVLIHTYTHCLHTYIPLHTMTWHSITLHTITYHYITYIHIIVAALMPQWTITTYGGYPETSGFNPPFCSLIRTDHRREGGKHHIFTLYQIKLFTL